MIEGFLPIEVETLEEAETLEEIETLEEAEILEEIETLVEADTIKVVKDLDPQDLLDIQDPQEEMDHLDCQDHVGPMGVLDHQVCLNHMWTAPGGIDSTYNQTQAPQPNPTLVLLDTTGLEHTFHGVDPG